MTVLGSLSYNFTHDVLDMDSASAKIIPSAECSRKLKSKAIEGLVLWYSPCFAFILALIDVGTGK